MNEDVLPEEELNQAEDLTKDLNHQAQKLLIY